PILINVDNTGVATLRTNTLSVGQHTIVAQYMPDQTSPAAGSTAAPVSITDDQAKTTTVVVSSTGPGNPPPAAIEAQPVTFVPTVSVNSPGQGAPTGSPNGGTVTFSVPNGAGTLTGTVAINTQGQAAFQANGLTIGQHTVTATFTPSNPTNFAGGTVMLVQSVAEVRLTRRAAVQGRAVAGDVLL